MITTEMGKTYFELSDGKIETKEELNEFFKQYGFEIVAENTLGDEECFKRVTRFGNGRGLEFDVIWFVNLVHIRFGDWDSGYMEGSFTSIMGSYLPDVDHLTFDFNDRGKRTLRFSVPNCTSKLN